MAGSARAALARLLPKPPSGPLPLALPQRRIYILPSRFGLAYAAALFFLQLGALNYNNNAAILLSLLLASVALISAVSTVRFLAGLTIDAFEADEAFAGNEQDCRFSLRSLRGPVRGELRLRADGRDARFDYLDNIAMAHWQTPAGPRGRHRLGAVRISTGYPMGLFHAWCVLAPHSDRLVYPAPETPAAPWPTRSDPSSGNRFTPRGGDEEWHALREFQRGDSLRDIAWKTSARHERWLVNETRSASQSPGLHFALDQVAHLEREHALSRLCRWVVLAEAERQPYVLDLGGRLIGPGIGEQQRRQALSALAELS